MRYDQEDYFKLNLGCGQNEDNKFPKPWLNVDCFGEVADYHSDIARLPSDWTASFDEVRASHVLEHLFLNQMDSAISEWVRVLRQGGLLRIIVPDLEIVTMNILAGLDGKNRKSLSIDETTAVLAQIYGIEYDNPETESRWRHRFLFNEALLISLLEKNKALVNVTRYLKTSDPANQFGIKDDSQNGFSLCIMAVKT